MILAIIYFITLSFAQPPDTLWMRTYGGADWDEGHSVQQTTDNGYIIAGYTCSFGAGGADVYLIKIDANGDSIWTRTYGGTADDGGWSVQQTSDGGYIITGVTNSFGAGADDVYLIKTNANGDTLWTKTYGEADDDLSYSVQQTADGGYIVAGSTWSFGVGTYDVYLIKTRPDTFNIDEEINVIKKVKDLPATMISGPLLLPEGKNCRVFDITGRVVIPDKIKPGIYFIEIDGRRIRKVIKIK